MGLLDTMTPRRAQTFLLLLSLPVLLDGCSGLHIGRTLTHGENDWPTFGRTGLHSSTIPTRIDTPLTPAWEYDLAAGTANGAPLVMDSLVFVGTMRGELHAVRLIDGKRTGWVSLGEAIHGTPATDGSTIFVPLAHSKESVVALDLASGRYRWQQSCGDVETSLLLQESNLFGGTMEGTLFCMDPASGAVRWLFTLPDNTTRKGIRSSPLAWRSLVVFGADDGSLYALDSATGKVRWQYRGNAPIVAPPVADSTVLIVGTTGGTVLAVDPPTGTLRWQKNVGAPVYGHALLTPTLAVVTTTAGMITGLSAVTGDLQWTLDAGGPILAGPSGAGDMLFVGTLHRELLALSLRDGAILWKETTEGRIKTSPVMSGGMVIVTTDDRSMIAFRGATPR
jgi:outer membrane protein assembly factor BamB